MRLSTSNSRLTGIAVALAIAVTAALTGSATAQMSHYKPTLVFNGDGKIGGVPVNPNGGFMATPSQGDPAPTKSHGRLRPRG